MAGVRAILTADEVPLAVPVVRGAAAREEEGPASRNATPPKPNVVRGELALTNEPLYQGDPILAVAAVDEVTAADAIERIMLDLQTLPFCVDPIESLRLDGPNARLEGNVYFGTEIKTYNGPRRTGRRSRRGGCLSAMRRTAGRSATSKPASRKLRS